VFEILEHTADIGFRAWGETPQQLFAHAALALEEIACDISRVEPRRAYPIAARGEDWESLLVAWLNEVLYYLDGQGVLMSRFDLEKVEPPEVSGEGWGEPRDPERHPPKLVVKGVTYHQLKVEEKDGRWTAEVFLDI